MSKPNDIPQDVWDAAILYSGVYAEPAGETLTNLRMDFARAIIAERERCAKIAEWMADTNSEFLPEEVVIACGHTAVAISSAIRNGDF